MELEVDVAIVGAGGAGLSLLTQLDRLAGSAAGAARMPSVALIDPRHAAGNDRTWCFWDGGASDVEAAVHRTWRRLELVGPAGERHRLDLHGMRYVMVRSADFYALADGAAHRLGALRVRAPALTVTDGEDRASVLAGDRTIRARWVFDSRPARPALPALTALVQHFRGWTVRLPPGVLDPDLAVLMDFSPPQPARGVAFGYVLPLDPCRALVEYTEFSGSRLEPAGYDAALREYLRRRWGGTVAAAAVVESVEDGAIPMTDAAAARRAGARVFRIGTAGGATRAATGYTFAAMQRQALAVATALLAGEVPVPPPPYPRRHRWMDAVLLRALDSGRVDGAVLFSRLFGRNPTERVLRFLDGSSGRWEDLALMTTAPQLPMIAASLADAAARASRRWAIIRGRKGDGSLGPLW